MRCSHQSVVRVRRRGKTSCTLSTLDSPPHSTAEHPVARHGRRLPTHRSNLAAARLARRPAHPARRRPPRPRSRSLFHVAPSTLDAELDAPAPAAAPLNHPHRRHGPRALDRAVAGREGRAHDAAELQPGRRRRGRHRNGSCPRRHRHTYTYKHTTTNSPRAQ
jgi:hypothetical protein